MCATKGEDNYVFCLLICTEGWRNTIKQKNPHYHIVWCLIITFMCLLIGLKLMAISSGFFPYYNGVVNQNTIIKWNGKLFLLH